jgi:uncharacterized membrane protein YbhN (UPF0104 family)
VSDHATRSAKERLAELRSFLHTAKIPGWAYPVIVATFSLIFVAALWISHLPRYLESYPVRWWLVLAAAVAISLQFVGYALSLWAAATRPLPFGELCALELGESVTAMATPEGVGSLALSMRFLAKQGFSTPEAGAATGLSSFVTSMTAAVLLPIGIILAASDLDVAKLRSEVPSSAWLVIIGIIAVAALVTVIVKAPSFRSKVRAWSRSAGQYLRLSIEQPGKTLVIVLGELVTVSGEVACLSLLLLAVNRSPHPGSLIVIVLISSTASAVVPIPGGLGAPEAILIAGLSSLGIDSVSALIASVSYRMLSYWLPPIPGAVALHRLHRRGRL